MTHHTDTRDTREFAREIKFLLDASAARAVRDWARARLAPDLHGGGPCGDQYDTSTLYFDTRDLDVFHRRGSFGRSKYRVRRYGAADVVFCERKMRTPGRLVKRRTCAGLDELARLGRADADATWTLHWFHQRLRLRQLQPAARVSYRRTARVGAGMHGPMRLTLDEALRADTADALAFDGEPDLAIAPGLTILELKYHAVVPALFKELAETFRLEAEPISKYRLAVSELGRLGAGTAAVAHPSILEKVS